MSDQQRYGLTSKNLMRTLPNVLHQDEGMRPLGMMIAQALEQLVGKTGLVKIYARIDELEEEALDMLAKDFDVGWYSFNYPVDIKRALIRDSFYVHRHLGTRGALERAISDVFPNSIVREWFEYGGQPYHFMVVLDVTAGKEPVHVGLIKRTIEYYKSVRSHLEEDVTARISCRIVIQTSTGGVLYRTPKAGTVPVVSTQGGVEEGALIAVATAQGGLYRVPKCGTPLNALR